MIGFGEKETKLNRHPKLDKPYFQELAQAWPVWKEVVNEQIIYEAYFEAQGEDIGISYWQALAKAAQGRPVFQECRTSGRIHAIKNQMDGKHIYLWRNPWDQWWSYKVTSYFDVANQLIVHARHAPPSVRCMLTELKLPGYEGRDLAGAFAFYSEQLLTSEQSYLIFYLLWCLALREGLENSDLMLNIDRLSDSAEYQFATLTQLKDAGIDGLDFSDCRVPQGRYLDRDQKFFAALEWRVHQWLTKDGWGHTDIEKIQALRQQYQPRSWSASIAQLSPAEIAEQASRARDLAMRFETNLAERTRAAASQLSELEYRAQAAEVRGQHAEASFLQEQARAQQIELREDDARAQLQLALEVSRGAQQLAQQAEARADAHQQHASALQIQLQQSQSRIDELEASNHHWLQKTQQSQIRIDELGGKSHHWQQQACALEVERNALLKSASWRITAPLRLMAGLVVHPAYTVRNGVNHVVHGTINTFQKPLSSLMAAVLRRPKLSYRINQVLLRYPALYQQLLGVAHRAGMLAGAQSMHSVHTPPTTGSVPPELVNLTPRARQVYADLKKAIENKKEAD